MYIVSAEGYTEDDQRPLDKARESIAHTERGLHHGAEIPANHHISTRSISGRYLWERSVSIPWRSITSNDTVREKYLQIAQLDHCAVDAGGTLQRLSSTFSALS
jgi:nitric oxide synthase oxygenase domain/subunit